MRFFLGTHHASQRWWDLEVPLFISRRTLEGRRTFPEAKAPWALDSGGFSELSMYGHWRTTEQEYVSFVLRLEREMDYLLWVAPQDWMCEPHMIEKTGSAVYVHQEMTVENFLRLRQELGEMVIPVLQGWTQDDYHNCWGLYEHHGVDLAQEPVVGLGTICRRQNTAEAGKIVRSLNGLRLHAFGVKIGGLESFGDALVSADSMAWSYRARMDYPLEGCTHKSCANCPRYAMRWYQQVQNGLAQQRLEVVA